jgi:hypothetical protein
MKRSGDICRLLSPDSTTPRRATTFDYRVMKTTLGFSAYSPELRFGTEATTIQLAVASLREAIHQARGAH